MKNKTAIKQLMAIGYPRNAARKIISQKDPCCPNNMQLLGAFIVAQQLVVLDLPLSAVSGVSLHNENGTLEVGVAFA